MKRPRIIFAHGSGAGLAHPWMTRWITALGSIADVCPFEYDYMAAGRRTPDRLPKLLARHKAVYDSQASRRFEQPLVLMGKSMGSRVGCHLANEPDVWVRALVCFGYPLVGIGKASKVRSEVLEALSTPILFVQGTRDRMCPLDRLEQVRGRLSAPSEVFVVESGNHSLETTKTYQRTSGESQADTDARILRAITHFLSRHVGDTP